MHDVRFACIDAPETSQTPWGPSSTQLLSALLPIGETVRLDPRDIDFFGRVVAEVHYNGKLLNVEMLREGQAAVYHRFLDRCGSRESQYLAAEAEAQRLKLGFWRQADPQMPWEYRAARRQAKSS